MLNVLELGSVQVKNGIDVLEPEKVYSIELRLLRDRLKELNAWPAAGDDILEMVPEFNRHSPPMTESDNEWLPLVVADSLKGVDIGYQYPAFFQKLLLNPKVRRQFMAELEMASNRLEN